ncbi:MAG TPA: RNA polymerase sigma-70 factor [Sunxiuqinia sp.]|nr:RNA polymerase sigma-70 factor [Sunxiuqinia sp.]
MNQELGKRIRKGDMKAFDLLYDQYSQRLYGFAFSMLKNKEDAKEIIQETFLKLWNKRTTIDSSYSLKSFLFSITYNITIDLLRKRAKDVDFQNQLKHYFDGEGARTDELVIFNELNENLSRLIGELPEQRRKVYMMSREEGMTHKEIATRLGISVKTVENHINLTLKYIRKKLGSNSLFVLLFIALFV